MNFLTQEENIKIEGEKTIQEFFKQSVFQKEMAKAKSYLAIFICALNPKNQKKIGTSLLKAKQFLDNVGKKEITEMCPYLLDENKDFKILRSEPGFNIPVLKNDLSALMELLNKANEENKSGFFIDISHKSPFSENHLIKTQFKNIPPNVDSNLAKKIFSDFGDIHQVYHKDGIWTILYEKINWFLPYALQVHITNGSKNRWFPLGDSSALCSFSSKTPCSKCKIKGHAERSCPGEYLISKLKGKKNTKEKNDTKEKIKSPSNQRTTRSQNKKSISVVLDDSDSFSDLDISEYKINLKNQEESPPPKKNKDKPKADEKPKEIPKKRNNK